MIRSKNTQFRQPAVLVHLLMVLTALLGIPATVHARCSVAIDTTQAAVLADKIWRNESGRDVTKLVWWNRGEHFASLGIGHFIWRRNWQ